MLTPLSPLDSERLRGFLAEAGYTHEEFRKKPELAEIPSRRAANLPRLLDRVREPSPRNLLVRWFCLGVPVERQFASAFVPERVLQAMVESGMLLHDGESLSPAVMLTPCDQYFFAADTAARMESQESSDVVLWPNPTTRLLHQFTIRKPSEATLDLGAGCGIQAVLAANHSRGVVATDLNPRASEFIRFNARLNGVSNIECLTGDTFEPVAERRFDLIVANPPFFVTPTYSQLYCENNMELDLYCRRLVRQAPGHLTEGGFLQMVFEWVSVRGQSWQDRVREWLDGSGCDAWILHTYVRDAAAYARERIRQTVPPEAEVETLTRWMEYYSRNGVEEIHGGILALRRRSGRNWIRVEEMPLAPAEPFGEAIRQAFAGFDFLVTHPSEEELLSAKPHLSPDAQLEHQLRQAEGKWQPVGMKLSLTRGIPASMRLEPAVAEFLARLDGRHSLGDLVDDLARASKADPAQVRRECIGIIQKLVERRLLFV